MNGRHARGWGISAHEMTNTTTKKAANSIVGKLTAGILAVAAVLPVAPVAAQGAGGSALVVGDSLEVGSGPYLRGALAGVPLELDAKRSRSSSEGLRVLASKLGPEHEVVVFPLGTNDFSASAFASNLAAARELAGQRCMVVATIARPNLRGSSTADLNRVVEQFAGTGNAQVADWRSAALSTPGVLGRDRIHASAPGYALRASLLAEAVQGCLLGGNLGGIPAPEDPNVTVPDAPSGRPRARRPKPKPQPPARLPAKAAILALDDAVDHVASLVGSALLEAQTAATTARPEPVLGASED